MTHEKPNKTVNSIEWNDAHNACVLASLAPGCENPKADEEIASVVKELQS